jgi:hypothetical protein
MRHCVIITLGPLCMCMCMDNCAYAVMNVCPQLTCMVQARTATSTLD